MKKLKQQLGVALSGNIIFLYIVFRDSLVFYLDNSKLNTNEVTRFIPLVRIRIIYYKIFEFCMLGVHINIDRKKINSGADAVSRIKTFYRFKMAHFFAYLNTILEI